jgi:hypothetical protein
VCWIIVVSFNEHMILTLPVSAHRNKTRIYGNSKSHASIVDVCIGKGPFRLDFRDTEISAELGRVQRYESAPYTIWEPFQTVLSQHKRIDRQYNSLSPILDDKIMLHRCNNSRPIGKFPLFIG